MTAALEGGEWSAARPGRTLSSGKTRYPLYRRLGGPQGRSGQAEQLVPNGIRSRTFQPVVSRYTDWATGPTVSLGPFAKLWKWQLAASWLSKCPFVRKEKLAPTGRIFMKFDIWVYFENLSRKFKFHWNLTRIMGVLHEDQYICMIIPRSILRMINVSDKRCREVKTHILCPITFSETRAAIEIT
jgi:hypothetical protein